MILGEVKNFCLDKYVAEGTKTILLVGSAVYKSKKECNDIDIFILKDHQSTPVFNEEIPFNDSILDVWIHDFDYFQKTFDLIPQNLNEIEKISSYLALLSKSITWYNDKSNIEHYISKTKKWKWKTEYNQFTSFKISTPSTLWAKRAIQEDLEILEFVNIRLKSGQPISHRRKDFPELHTKTSKKITMNAYFGTKELIQRTGKGQEWTEWKDTEKYIKKGEWGKALASIKDVLRFLVRSRLSSPPQQFLDPNIWYLAENQIRNDESFRILSQVFI